ncbi:Six-hairpin glycosidase-like protein [Aspergillus avenaceus]|uniref:Six-hairpin glycosidase-like protein n=1 Tax=Aspergillus avenaceus TaxID=36643 RepID=A0A5N6U8Q0_ASPAV|nr:Six-hairpin glycosidase-like protein [Aspergillus avenaceus]
MFFTTILLLASPALSRIHRQSIISKYNVVRTDLITNETTPLQVGNGNFAFNVDNTGMQTFLPFNTLSSWGWHNDSLPTNGERIQDYTGIPKLTHGRNVSYDIPDPSLPEASQWLTANPNRINLARIGLVYKGEYVSAEQISESRQELDLWNGTITSRFVIAGEPVEVVTQGDLESDSVVVWVKSELLRVGELGVQIDLPFPVVHSTEFKFEVFVGSYGVSGDHGSFLVGVGDTAGIHHLMGGTEYWVNLRWETASPITVGRVDDATHRYVLVPGENATEMAFTASFSPDRRDADSPATVQRRSRAAWNQYWGEGGFVDVTGSSDPAAGELQRRIILSQYHVRVNSAAGGQSPQESGLMNNGWYGKFHMEMVVWHNAHWVTWGRAEIFNDIFPGVYEALLPSSLERARLMGWDGARWPKMTDVVSGINSPGGINGLLLWQQPHPMYLASLAYLASPTRETLERWDRVLTATADYMASYAWGNESSGYYDLGPPTYGVTENTPPDETLNLAYEIAYWRYGLDVAREWKTKLNQPIPAQWTTVAENLAPPPQVDGLYTVYEGLNSSWWNDTSLTKDPRSLIMLQGVLPDTPAVDPEIALKTAEKVWDVWTDDKIRGWGRPVLAINAARVGRPDKAVYHLTAFDYWKFDDAGFAERGGDGGTPPPFMPGNAGLLYAVAYMAAGWNGSTGDAPGFPVEDGWVVKHEGLLKAP